MAPTDRHALPQLQQYMHLARSALLEITPKETSI